MSSRGSTLIADRRVHACVGTVEVVRYDRAGKWYVEDVLGRDHVSLSEAVDIAKQPDAEVFYGVLGGSLFDKRVSRLRGDHIGAVHDE